MKYALLFVLLFGLCNNYIAQKKKISEKEKIISVVMAQKDAWNNGDMEAYMDGYWKSDSLKFIGKNGIQFGWKNTLENYKKGYPDKAAMGKLEFTIVQVDLLSSSSAFMIGKWKLTREKDSPQGYFTLLWKKINGKWKVVTDHSS
jgi:ketosteroid isomerase-like protein